LGDQQVSLDAFLSYGFRPFFLGAAAFAVCAMAVWMAAIGAQQFGGSADWLPVAGSIYAWHAHEMVLGFGIAAVAGFLLTAVPNWTGALPLSGRPLLLLFGVWLAGRLAMAFSGLLPAVLVATTDLIFVPLLGAVAARQLLVKPAQRNLMFLVILALICAGNGAYHLGISGTAAINGLAGVRLALVLLVLMIAVVGGRIVPVFTHNWLHVNAIPGGVPRRYPWLDATAIASVAVFALLQIVRVPDALAGVVALAAGLANGLRLALWRGLATRRAPIVWVLHVGYAWLVIGMLLAAMGAFAGGIWNMAAMHAFGVGAVGTMILAVMSRASLGHTGRALVAPSAIVLAYYLITLAAVLRVFGAAVVPAHYPEILLAAGSAWMAAFALFIYVFAPILATPRISML
jgi:uncharacterized protein involved in response to NO